jgi:hypothetical protein
LKKKKKTKKRKNKEKKEKIFEIGERNVKMEDCGKKSYSRSKTHQGLYRRLKKKKNKMKKKKKDKRRKDVRNSREKCKVWRLWNEILKPQRIVVPFEEQKEEEEGEEEEEKK